MEVDDTTNLKPLEPLEEATVYFFKTEDTDDHMSNNIVVRKDSNLRTVLKAIARVFSPVKRKYFIH
jgi:hypothetical protein